MQAAGMFASKAVEIDTYSFGPSRSGKDIHWITAGGAIKTLRSPAEVIEETASVASAGLGGIFFLADADGMFWSESADGTSATISIRRWRAGVDETLLSGVESQFAVQNGRLVAVQADNHTLVEVDLAGGSRRVVSKDLEPAILGPRGIALTDSHTWVCSDTNVVKLARDDTETKVPLDRGCRSIAVHGGSVFVAGLGAGDLPAGAVVLDDLRTLPLAKLPATWQPVDIAVDDRCVFILAFDGADGGVLALPHPE